MKKINANLFLVLLIVVGIVTALGIIFFGGAPSNAGVAGLFVTDDLLTAADPADVQIDLRKQDTGNYLLVLLSERKDIVGFDLSFLSDNQFISFVPADNYNVQIANSFDNLGNIQISYITNQPGNTFEETRNSDGELVLGELRKSDPQKVGNFDLVATSSSIVTFDKTLTVEFGEFAANAEFVSGSFDDFVVANKQRLINARKASPDRPVNVKVRSLKPAIVSAPTGKETATVFVKPLAESSAKPKTCENSANNCYQVLTNIPERKNDNCTAFGDKVTATDYAAIRSEIGNKCAIKTIRATACGTADQNGNGEVDGNDLWLYFVRLRENKCLSLDEISKKYGKDFTARKYVTKPVTAPQICQADTDCASNQTCYQPPMPVCPEGQACAQVMPNKVCRSK